MQLSSLSLDSLDPSDLERVPFVIVGGGGDKEHRGNDAAVVSLFNAKGFEVNFVGGFSIPAAVVSLLLVKCSDVNLVGGLSASFELGALEGKERGQDEKQYALVR